MDNPAGEAVTPVSRNSDYYTGVAGRNGILDAITRRDTTGGSYKVDVALIYQSQWLVNSVGTYPEDVWKDVCERNGKPAFRHYRSMGQTIPVLMKALKEHERETAQFKDGCFKEVGNKAIGAKMKIVKPVVQWQGPSGNGFDAARWPEDLMTEIVQ